MDKTKVSTEDILKIDELCEAHPFSKSMVLDFARDVSGEAAIYLMNEIINESQVRKDKQMGEIAHAATFRQRSRQQKQALMGRLAKEKTLQSDKAQEDAERIHALKVQEGIDNGFDPKDLKKLSDLVAQMGADGERTSDDVRYGLLFISSIAYEHNT